MKKNFIRLELHGMLFLDKLKCLLKSSHCTLCDGGRVWAYKFEIVLSEMFIFCIRGASGSRVTWLSSFQTYRITVKIPKLFHSQPFNMICFSKTHFNGEWSMQPDQLCIDSPIKNAYKVFIIGVSYHKVPYVSMTVPVKFHSFQILIPKDIDFSIDLWWKYEYQEV